MNLLNILGKIKRKRPIMILLILAYGTNKIGFGENWNSVTNTKNFKCGQMPTGK
jgi:hypothetical protein